MINEALFLIVEQERDIFYNKSPNISICLFEWLSAAAACQPPLPSGESTFGGPLPSL